MNADRYINQILKPHIVPYPNHPNQILEQDNNARLHTARVTQDFQRENNIDLLPQQARPPRALIPSNTFGMPFRGS